jgi:hypothetical protein
MSFLDKIQKFFYKAEDRLKTNINEFTGKTTFDKFNKDNIHTKYEENNKVHDADEYQLYKDGKKVNNTEKQSILNSGDNDTNDSDHIKENNSNPLNKNQTDDINFEVVDEESAYPSFNDVKSFKK